MEVLGEACGGGDAGAHPRQRPAAAAITAITALGCERRDPARACVKEARACPPGVRAAAGSRRSRAESERGPHRCGYHGRAGGECGAGRREAVAGAGSVEPLGGGRTPLSLAALPSRFVGQGSEALGAASCHALGSGLRGWSPGWVSRLGIRDPRVWATWTTSALGGPGHRGLTDPSCPASSYVSLGGGGGGALVVTATKEKRRILFSRRWTCCRPGRRNAHTRREGACGP